MPVDNNQNSAYSTVSDDQVGDSLCSSNIDVENDTNVKSGNLKENIEVVESKIETTFRQENKTTFSKVKISRPKIYTNPHNQKTLLHSLLKKARLFEIRKITRRISKLRSLKSSEDEKLKNERKISRLLKEMEEMKGFIIESLVLRVLKIFNHKSVDKDTKLWEAAQNGPNDIEKMISVCASNMNDEGIQDTAFFKILSSKDVIKKFVFISQGINISSRKNKNKLIEKNKTNKFMDKNRKSAISSRTKRIKSIDKTAQGVSKASKISEKLKPDIDNGNAVVDKPVTENLERNKKPSPSKTKREMKSIAADSKRIKNIDKRAEESISKVSIKSDKIKHDIDNDKAIVYKPVTKNLEQEKKTSQSKKKREIKSVAADSFFLSHQNNEEMQSDVEEEEFTAPALPSNNQNIPVKSKNRMGQRQRKMLLDKSQDKNIRKQSNNRNYPPKRLNKRHLGVHKNNASVPFGKKKKIDENLHPSWVAKQSLKAKQNINVFSGTKIVFDD